MASVFRRRITQQIINTLKPILKGSEIAFMYDNLPLHIKFNQPKYLPPQFELKWKDVVKLNPGIKDRIHPTTVFTYLKNQEFSNENFITDISTHPVNTEQFIFTIDQEIFKPTVILDIVNGINNIPSKSTFFKTTPPEDIIVEFSSPNIAKPFHYGHFRSTILGNYISNICKYVGHKVTRMNYIGDWGLQYGILAVGFNKFGNEEKLKSDPLQHLFEVYKEANEMNDNDPEFRDKAKAYFKKMEEGDKEVLSRWQRLRDISLAEMNPVYKRLNIAFDETEGESNYASKTDIICDDMISKNIAVSQEDGSVSASIETEDKMETTVIKRKDGTSLYITRDIAAALDRWKRYRFDTSYYVVDSSQGQHFTHLKSILKALGHDWSNDLHHVAFGRVLNFSTRKGTAVFLNDILDEAKERTLERMEKSENTKVVGDFSAVADVLGIASLVINDFRSRRRRHVEFDWERVLNMNSDSGVTLQYCHARLHSIKKNCGVNLCLDCELYSLVEPEALSLIAYLAKFDEIVYNSYVELEPCVLVQYLFGLRNEVGRAVKVLTVKGSNPYVARARLLLFHASYLVLQKSFQILGITPLDEM